MSQSQKSVGAVGVVKSVEGLWRHTVTPPTSLLNYRHSTTTEKWSISVISVDPTIIAFIHHSQLTTMTTLKMVIQ
jgi:hypothetical protein